MGGYGSTRWDTTVTRPTTDGLPKLDVRALARAGALRPGTSASVRWDGSSIVVAVPENIPDLLTLDYQTRSGSRAWEAVRERIPLTRTACTFGARVWFACPGCGERCAVLYALVGRFRCRGCHRLAYASTRRASRE